jgi:hypothetical protein
MKKTILIFLLIAIVTKGYSQTKESKFVTGKPILGKAITFNTNKILYPKLAWSHFKDKQGNMYKVYAPKTSFSTPPFKIYKYTATGEGFLYFNSLDNNIGYETSPTGMKFTFDENANFYWQMGNCIMKLSNEGIIETLVGVWKENRNLKDGKGSNGLLAGHLYKLKYNSFDKSIYFSERVDKSQAYETFEGKVLGFNKIANSAPVVLRKCSTDGTLTTLKYKDGSLFLEAENDFWFAPNGDIIYRTSATAFTSRAYDIFRWDGKNKPVAVVKFHGGLFNGIKGDKGRWTVGDTSFARVTANPEQVIVNSKNEIIIYDGDARRFVKVNGNKVTAYSGTSDMQQVINGITLAAKSKDKDGTATTAEFYSVGTITIDKDDNMFFASKIGVRKLTPNGTVTTIIKATQKKTEKITDNEN